MNVYKQQNYLKTTKVNITEPVLHQLWSIISNFLASLRRTASIQPILSPLMHSIKSFILFQLYKTFLYLLPYLLIYRNYYLPQNS